MSICVVECCIMGTSTLTMSVDAPAIQATPSKTPAASAPFNIPAELAHHLALAVVAKALGIDYELRLPTFVTCDFDQSLATRPVLA